MKIELEISEEEIRDALARKVRVAIADQTNQWSVDDYIKDVIRDKWKAVASEMVEEELRNSNQLKAKIIAAIEAKIKSQVSALMKVKG